VPGLPAGQVTGRSKRAVRPSGPENGSMSIWGRAKAKTEELLGRAEELYGESHGDAAARLDGEARRLEGEAEEGSEEHEAAPRHPDDGAAPVR
jgi:uncharacterized protein YjbJ (UPF0337 family)